MESGCPHSRCATKSQFSAFQDAVRLQLARLLRRTTFKPACTDCNNISVPLACLSCDYIGCPQHSIHEHDLACGMSPESEGFLWCYKCQDVILDPKFESIKAAEIKQILQNKEVKPLATESENAQIGIRPTYHATQGLRGLVNMGSTCYVSVVLQSLVHNPLVRAFFLAGGHQRENCTHSSCLVCSVDRLYCDFFSSNSVLGYGVSDLLISMAEKRPVMGSGSTEQDAHEFYLMLLDEFHSTHHNSPHLGIKCEVPSQCGCVAHRAFAGSTESTLACTCGQKTRRWEPIVDLGLDLNTDPRAGVTTLEQALKRFTMSEMIANYTCSNCGLQNTTSKQLKLSQLPASLMIQLKRFKHMGAKGSMKIDTPVEFGLQLDLGPYTSTVSRDEKGGSSQDERKAFNGGTVPKGQLIYELYGVICHTGSLDTGHYRCMMKHSSGKWYHFDDTVVTAIDVQKVLSTRDAYLLYYVIKWAV